MPTVVVQPVIEQSALENPNCDSPPRKKRVQRRQQQFHPFLKLPRELRQKILCLAIETKVLDDFEKSLGRSFSLLFDRSTLMVTYRLERKGQHCLLSNQTPTIQDGYG